MDANEELNAFVEGLKAGAAGARWEQGETPHPEAAPNTGPKPNQAAGSQAGSAPTPPPVGDAEVNNEPIFTRAKGNKGTTPPPPGPAAPKGQGGRPRPPLWAAAIAAGLFLAASVALGVTAASLTRGPAPVVLQVVGAPPAPPAALTPFVPVSRPQAAVPQVRPWTVQDLGGPEGHELPPIMDEFEHQRLKEDLRETLRRHGYLPPTYDLPSQPEPPVPSEERPEPPNNVRFASGRSS